MSFGGDVLLQMSSMNPDILESMIIIGANSDWDAQDYPEMLKTYSFEKYRRIFNGYMNFHSQGDEQIKTYN